MITGVQCAFYRNSAALGGGWASPTMNLVDGIKDFEVNDAWEEFENSIRRGRGLKTFHQTMEAVELSTMLLIPDNVLQGTTTATSTGNPDWDDFRAFQTAKRKRLPMDVMVLNGPMTENGAEGFRMFMGVFGFSVSQKNEDGLMVAVTMKPMLPDAATLATSPAAQVGLEVRVASGAPTYSLWGAETFTLTPS